MSTIVNLLRSLDCEGDERANNPVASFNTGFNARPFVTSFSKPTAVCEGSPYDRILDSWPWLRQILLDLLEPDIGGQVQAATLQTIVCALVDQWDNIRVQSSPTPVC